MESSRWHPQRWLGAWPLAAVLLGGCGSSHETPPLDFGELPVFQSPTVPEQPSFTPVGYIPTTNLFSSLASTPTKEYWSFDAPREQPLDAGLPDLVELPRVAEPAFGPLPEPPFDELTIARLLPPTSIPASQMPAVDEREVGDGPELISPRKESQSTQLTESQAPPIVEESIAPAPIVAPNKEQLTPTERRLLAAVLRDASSAATGVLTDARLDELARGKIRAAYALADRGAHYAAREELIEVLRMISQAKDAAAGNPERGQALAAGLRALDEATDFAPRGTQLEAELDLAVVTAAHRTPIAAQLNIAHALPQQLLDAYFRYAQFELALAVAGDPAGSMALHALGKVNSQLGKLEPERHRLAERRAIAFQQAALLAHNQNHLAAHELAVLLAQSGHYGEAEHLLLQVAAREPNPVVYRNLAHVQEKLGDYETAQANRRQAAQLTGQGVGGAQHVAWVSPEEFARTGGRSGVVATAAAAPVTGVPLPGQRAPLNQSIRR
jgi:tetratricopeptide (TPR) repeat protein